MVVATDQGATGDGGEAISDTTVRSNAWYDAPLIGVTSIAIGGADARSGRRESTEPIKARSVRGLLREWTRFLLAGYVSGQGLRDIEERIYGGVHGGSPKASALQVQVRTERGGVSPVPWNEGHGAELGWSDTDSVALNGNRYLAGVQYLGSQSFRKPRDGHERWLYPPGHRVTLRLRWRPTSAGASASDDERLVWASLWLLVNLGGIGGRSSRGFGSLDFADALPQRMSELLPGLSSHLGAGPTEAASHLGAGLGALQATFHSGAASVRRPHLATLAHTRVEVVDHLFASAHDAQRALGDAMFAYRHHRNPDTDATIRGDTNATLERPAWGLPLGMPTTTLVPASRDVHRWPSPLTFTVSRLTSAAGDISGYVLVAVARDVDLVDARSAQGTYRTAVGGRQGLSGEGAIPALFRQFLDDQRTVAHVVKSPWSAVTAWP